MIIAKYPFVITVRLVDGSSYNEGRLEVYYSGRWGTVCNDGWNDSYAGLVCTQLGFGSSGKLSNFGAGTGTIFLDKVMCSINDTILASCGHYGVGVTVGCNHNDDVGVKCDGMQLCNYNLIIKCFLALLKVLQIHYKDLHQVQIFKCKISISYMGIS